MVQGTRIYPDEETIKKLDQIRKDNWQIQGKGHVETVRFLTNFYLKVGPIEKMITEEIPKAIERSFKKSLARAITRLIEGDS